jgi:hypothetical protein
MTLRSALKLVTAVGTFTVLTATLLVVATGASGGRHDAAPTTTTEVASTEVASTEAVGTRAVSARVSPPICWEASPTRGAAAGDALYWTIGEHTFRRSTSNNAAICSAMFPTLTPDVFGQSRAFAGIDTDSATGERTLGLWLSNTDGTNKRLLVSHGDATSVSDPVFSDDGSALYFTAEHPTHFELHRFDIGTSSLETLIEDKQSIAVPTIQRRLDDTDAVAVRVGDCNNDKPTDVHVSTGNTHVSLHAQVNALNDRWLTPVGWQSNDELVVLSRPTSCEGPAELLVIRSLMTTPKVDVVETNVSQAVLQRAPSDNGPSSINLPTNFTAIS